MESLRQQVKNPDSLEEAILGLLLQAVREEQAWPSEFPRQHNDVTN